MSQETVEIVRKIFEAVERGDTETVVSLYDPAFDFDFSRHPWSGVSGDVSHYSGLDGLRRWYQEWTEAWEAYEERSEELIEAGEQVVSVVSSRARGRMSGAPVESPHHAAGVWTLRNGKVVRTVWFPSREEALEAVGLRE
jgi:ketosteroid isomerase-like protein